MKSKAKGRWLRSIQVERSPPANGKSFLNWAKKQRDREDSQTNIRKIVTYWKPRLEKFLRKEGFVHLRGIAQVSGTICRPPSKELAAMMKSLLQREPRNEQAKYALRVAQRGRIEKQYLFIYDAFDSHPIAYEAWHALKWIEQIEMALAAGKIDQVGGYAFNFGRALAQADALHAMECLANKATPRGRHAAGYKETRTAWLSFPPKPGNSPSAEWLLGTMHAQKTAEWEPSKNRVRFRTSDRGGWSRWITEASFRNNLTRWKQSFTVSPIG